MILSKIEIKILAKRAIYGTLGCKGLTFEWREGRSEGR